MSSNLKILIQHCHKKNEIAGVLTYIESLTEELNLRNIEYHIISTTDTSFKDWIKWMLWANVIYMHSNDPIFTVVGKLLLRKIFLMYHYKFYLTNCDLDNINFSDRLKIEIKHLTNIKHLPLKWKFERFYQILKLGGRLTSSFWADELLANTKFMANSTFLPRNIHVFPYPIPSDKTISNNVHKTIDDLDSPLTFTFAGRLCKDKGVDILLSAIERLTTVNSNLNFIVKIVGDGGLSDNLREMAAKAKIENYVMFLGKLPLDETMNLMKRSIAVIIPSRYPEPAGRVLLESGIVGTLPIASRIGGLPELGGDESLYFESEDVVGLTNLMAMCLEAPEEALNRGLQLQSRLKDKHSLSQHLDQLLNLFTAI